MRCIGVEECSRQEGNGCKTSAGGTEGAGEGPIEEWRGGR